jgi:hypothetical protein
MVSWDFILFMLGECSLRVSGSMTLYGPNVVAVSDESIIDSAND